MGKHGTNVVAITRQFGSLGRPIAKMVAERLGFAYYDRDIIEMAAEKIGQPVYKLSEYDGHKVTPYRKMMFPLGFGVSAKQDQLFEIEKKIIIDFAKQENCVVVGRCADYVLTEADVANLYNVFIYAPYGARYNYCLKNLGFTEEAVGKYMEKIDNARADFYKHYTGEKFESVRYRSLMIDSSSMPIEKVAEFICEGAGLRFGLSGKGGFEGDEQVRETPDSGIC